MVVCVIPLLWGGYLKLNMAATLKFKASCLAYSLEDIIDLKQKEKIQFLYKEKCYWVGWNHF